MTVAIENHLTTTEVARKLRITEARVRQFVMEGRLTPERIGRMMLFPREQVEEFAKQERPNGRPKNS